MHTRPRHASTRVIHPDDYPQMICPGRHCAGLDVSLLHRRPLRTGHHAAHVLRAAADAVEAGYYEYGDDEEIGALRAALEAALYALRLDLPVPDMPVLT